MKKKLRLKLFAFIVICSMSVFCIKTQTPTYAEPGVCEDRLNFCEAGCTTGDTCCFDGCFNKYVDCKCPNYPNDCRFKKVNCVPL